MSTPSASATSVTTPRRGPRAEFLLLGLAVISLVTLLITIRSVWSGLPAHPLLIHIPVVMVPVTVIGALALTVRPAWFERYGVLVCLAAIISMSSIFLAENAGGQLQNALHLHGEAARLINEHASAANVLAILTAALTLLLLVDFAAHRVGTGMTFGVGSVDTVLGSAATRLVLRGLVAIFALACAYYVYRVGDLGARSVWAGTFQHG